VEGLDPIVPLEPDEATGSSALALVSSLAG